MSHDSMVIFNLFNSFQCTKSKKFTCTLVTRTVPKALCNKTILLSVELKVRIQEFYSSSLLFG